MCTVKHGPFEGKSPRLERKYKLFPFAEYHHKVFSSVNLAMSLEIEVEACTPSNSPNARDPRSTLCSLPRHTAPQGTDLPLSMPIASFGPSDLPQLSAQLLENLKLAGHEAPTPLQRHVVPIALAGRDALIVGAGRDSQAASLLLPVVARLMLDPRALPAKSGGLRAVVLATTREAASRTVQEARQLVLRTPLRCTLACGGTPVDETLAELSAGVELLVAPSNSPSSNPSRKPLSAGVELLVATPGRLVDLVERGRAVLGGLKVLALLEVDRLLDLG